MKEKYKTVVLTQTEGGAETEVIDGFPEHAQLLGVVVSFVTPVVCVLAHAASQTSADRSEPGGAELGANLDHDNGH